MQGENNTSERERKIQKIGLFVISYLRWLIIVAVVVVLVAGYFFLIGPKYKKIMQLTENDSQQAEIDYSKKKKELADLGTLATIYHHDIDADEIKKIDALLPAENPEEELFTQLEYLVAGNGLVMTSLVISPEKEATASQGDVPEQARSQEEKTQPAITLPKEIGKIKANLNIIGVDYQGLKNILNTLENNLRIMDITYLNYAPPDGTLTLELYTYYLKEM